MPSRKKPQPQTLREVLQGYTVPILGKLARLLTSNPPTRKEELVNLIHQQMADPARLRELWEGLDKLQKAAVAETVHAPDARFDTARFQAKYGRGPEWGGRSRYGDMAKPSRLNLFIYGVTMPADLRNWLKAFVPRPRQVQIETLDELPASFTLPKSGYIYGAEPAAVEVDVERVDMERIAQHDLRAVLRLIDTGQVRASEKTGRTSAAGLQAIAGVLQGEDFYSQRDSSGAWRVEPGLIRSFAWPLILQAAGLVSIVGAKLQLTPAGQKALTLPPHQVLCQAWKRWQKSTLLDEFSRVQTIKGQTKAGKQKKLTAVSSRRAVIVEALQAVPPQKWIAMAEFSRFMRAADYAFQVSRDLWVLYIGHQEYGSLGYAGSGEWNILQERYILAFLFEYAATLGLIDVAYVDPSGARQDFRTLWGTDAYDALSRYDGLLYFRINGLGAWCLGLVEAYEPTPVEVRQMLRVLPNLDVVAVHPLPPGDVLALEQFAERTSDVVWKIRSDLLLQALEQGQSAADLQAFLTARSGGNLPDTVRIFFEEAAERASRLVDRGLARLIEAQDAALAQLIANDSRLRALCMLAGERTIVVPAETESAFRRALRELGYGITGA